MHPNTSFWRPSRRPINPHKRKNLTQTHKGFRNEYKILPMSFLEPQRKEMLESLLEGFTHAVFICPQDDRPREFSDDTILTQTHFLSIESLFAQDDNRPDEGAILDLLEVESNEFSPPISHHSDDVMSALTHGGNMIRRTIDDMTSVVGVHRYPQKIIACGSHLLCTMWIRSVVRSQQKASVPGRKREFDPIIRIIEAHTPENGELGVSTTAHIHPRHGTRFIVSDVETPH